MSISLLVRVSLPLSIVDRSNPKKQAAPVLRLVSLPEVDSEVITNSPRWQIILMISLVPQLAT